MRQVMRTISREVACEDPSSCMLTPQRPYAELPETMSEGLDKRDGIAARVLLETGMKIWSVPHGDMGINTNKVAVPEGAAGSPPF